nr:retrovirus-related Pol polyprotein from transposon TNT 1-94 [Tanacetum cinerariifolium]
STDAEYIAAFDASNEAVWIRKFISGLGIVLTIEEPISMYYDNTGAIAIAKDDRVTKGANVVIKAIFRSVCEAVSTTLVVNKGFVPPPDVCRKIPLDHLQI